MWPEPLKLCTIAAAVLAGSWLLWLGLSGGEPSTPSGTLPISTAFSVTPVSSFPTGATRERTPPEILTFAPIRPTPRTWHWYVPEGCHPALRLSPLCFRPTPEPAGWLGETGSENR